MISSALSLSFGVAVAHRLFANAFSVVEHNPLSHIRHACTAQVHMTKFSLNKKHFFLFYFRCCVGFNENIFSQLIVLNMNDKWLFCDCLTPVRQTCSVANVHDTHTHTHTCESQMYVICSAAINVRDTNANYETANCAARFKRTPVAMVRQQQLPTFLPHTHSASALLSLPTGSTIRSRLCVLRRFS